MAAPLKTYDLAKVVLIIGGYRITGFGADAAISFEAGSEIVEKSVGADGQVTVSRNNDKSVTATLTFMETSNAVRILDELRRQQAAQDAILPLPFTMSDPVTGDTISDQWAVIASYMVPTKAKNASEREVQIILPYGLENMVLAQNIAL